MTAWTCEKCGWAGRTTQKSGHVTHRCPKQGRLKKALEKQTKAAEGAATFWRFFPCLCGCGEQVGQVKGLRAKHYLNTEHYEAHRALQRRSMGRKASLEDEPESTQERRLAEEMAPVAAKEEARARDAEYVPMVTGRDSLLLWAKCLGFAVDGPRVTE